MAWTDYTRAEVFGQRVFRPYSDGLADIEAVLNGMLFAYADVAKAFVPLHKRDLLLIHGEKGSLLLYSRIASKHLPTHICASMVTVLGKEISDEEVVDKPTRTSDEALGADFLNAMKTAQIVDPIAIQLPPEFFSAAMTQKPEYAEMVNAAAGILLKKEIEVRMSQIENEKPKKIFLSHKSIDKAIVREVAETLREIGFDPWLDEDMMAAGANLNRAIKQGMTDSCAAVFFITPNFKDADWIADEVDHALVEKKKKQNRFALVPLLLTSPDGKKGAVLDMMEQFVHKDVQYPQIVREILRAIPIRMNQVIWKDDA